MANLYCMMVLLLLDEGPHPDLKLALSLYLKQVKLSFNIEVMASLPAGLTISGCIC